MSDSSEDEDLSRFKEAVDTSFVKIINECRGNTLEYTSTDKPHSERQLEVSSHYNDVRVPKHLQKQISDKISAIIEKNVEYVHIEHSVVKPLKTKGGVKLFRESKGYLSCEDVKDTYTETHNKLSKKMKFASKKFDGKEPDEYDKIKAVVVTGDYVLSQKDVKHWKSRRKEKLYKYKAIGKNNNVFITV